MPHKLVPANKVHKNYYSAGPFNSGVEVQQYLEYFKHKNVKYVAYRIVPTLHGIYINIEY